MKIKKNNSDDRIEIRSKKIRDMIGTPPPVSIRWGITIITLAIVILFIAVLCVPYPYGHGITIFKQIFGL